MFAAQFPMFERITMKLKIYYLMKYREKKSKT